MLKGGGMHGQLVTGRTISMGPQWQWRRHPTEVTAEAGNSGCSGGSARAVRGQTTINQKVAAKMFKIILLM